MLISLPIVNCRSQRAITSRVILILRIVYSHWRTPVRRSYRGGSRTVKLPELPSRITPEVDWINVGRVSEITRR